MNINLKFRLKIYLKQNLHVLKYEPWFISNSQDCHICNSKVRDGKMRIHCKQVSRIEEVYLILREEMEIYTLPVGCNLLQIYYPLYRD
jgi:hypothetical protein